MSSAPQGASGGRVVVTGASRGIGRAVVESLVGAGGSVAAIGRDYDALDEVAALEPTRIVPVPADLDDPDARAAVVERAAEAIGGIDALVSCAGIVRYAEVGAITEEDVAAQLSTNLVAPLMLSQAAAVHMRTQGTGGAIVHVASTLAIRPAKASAAYAATKGGLLALTRSLAHELARDRIRVNAVAPGVVETAMVRGRLDTERAGLERLHPLGRLGTPQDVAGAVLHLLDATWTTGAVLVVDGGQLVGGPDAHT